LCSLDAKSVDKVSKTPDAAYVVVQQNQDTVNSDDNGFSTPFVSSKRLRKSAAKRFQLRGTLQRSLRSWEMRRLTCPLRLLRLRSLDLVLECF
jgi:hypothetical protein